MIDISELKVGDEIADSSGAIRVVEYVSEAFIVYSWETFVGKCDRVLPAAEFSRWKKVEPPPIDPEQVWWTGTGQHIQPCRGDYVNGTKFRITSYEVVK